MYRHKPLSQYIAEGKTEADYVLNELYFIRCNCANAKDRLTEYDERLTSSKISNMSATPVSGGGDATSNAWDKIIDAKDKPESEYRENRHFISRHENAMSVLNRAERIILEWYYQRFKGGRYNSVYDVIRDVNMAKPTIYKWRITAYEKYKRAYGETRAQNDR